MQLVADGSLRIQDQLSFGYTHATACSLLGPLLYARKRAGERGSAKPLRPTPFIRRAKRRGHRSGARRVAVERISRVLAHRSREL
jgi:hypothetical protein